MGFFMADEDIDLDDGGEDAGAGSDTGKKGGLGALLPTLLKWVAIVIGAIILIVTVVVITMNIMNKNGNATASVIPVSSEYTSKREELDWYTSIGTIQTTSDDIPPANIIVEVVLGYKTQDKTASTEITRRQIEIKDFLRRYFSAKSKNELRVQDEDKLRMEIRNAINDDILINSKIRDVRFMTRNIVE